MFARRWSSREVSQMWQEIKNSSVSELDAHCLPRGRSRDVIVSIGSCRGAGDWESTTRGQGTGLTTRSLQFRVFIGLRNHL